MVEIWGSYVCEEGNAGNLCDPDHKLDQLDFDDGNLGVLAAEENVGNFSDPDHGRSGSL